MLGRKACSLLAKVFAKILYRLPRRVIGRQLLSLECSLDLGINVIMPFLIWVEVSLRLNMFVKALINVGAISLAHSWKNFVGMPSHPSTLPLGREEMASRMSFKERSLVRSLFVSSKT